MLKISANKRFKKDYKLCEKRGYDTNRLLEVINMLAFEQILPEKYHDHILTGRYSGCRECHIQPDWLLIYQINSGELELLLMRTGSHSDLF